MEHRGASRETLQQRHARREFHGITTSMIAHPNLTTPEPMTMTETLEIYFNVLKDPTLTPAQRETIERAIMGDK